MASPLGLTEITYDGEDFLVKAGWCEDDAWAEEIYLPEHKDGDVILHYQSMILMDQEVIDEINEIVKEVFEW